ncbi:SDR family oxidoreductase [Sphingomonas corticis]|jgi:NAD(P)-dependent dehydrogenase (short-subunit alcohol dehydrogenase family)|uniref:SDR family oxidoreductase n=1 Tax=Sphingomonas corticis TaxID=2722791 RepID=A0ABX1CGN3_9SPHN|nr:SDR family oxidoreductase [Sphingomonas corticis]NJR77172.1 SDR family oxidoreductase [Sphingomonas corticis]
MRVLVTGGGKRLGAAIARAVAGAGHAVVIHYGRSRDEAEALARELGGATVGGDLADTAALPALFARAARGDAIHGLVNSASLFEEDRPERIDPALATRLHAVNCVAPAVLAAALAGQGGEGAVVNLLDQKLANPNPDYFSYSLSKYALAGATTMMAQAFAPRVRVNAVAPGLTLRSGDQSDAAFDRVARMNLLGRPVGAENVAAAVVYLLEARSVTGQTLYVDAGQRFLKRDGDVMFEGRDG